MLAMILRIVNRIHSIYVHIVPVDDADAYGVILRMFKRKKISSEYLWVFF